MNTYYRIDIVMTGKSHGASDEAYRIFNSEHKCCDTLADVQSLLLTLYGTCKRQPVNVDKQDGGTEQVGYLYCFNNSDISHFPVEKWHEQDWVEIHEVSERIVLLQ